MKRLLLLIFLAGCPGPLAALEPVEAPKPWCELRRMPNGHYQTLYRTQKGYRPYIALVDGDLQRLTFPSGDYEPLGPPR
jgi:hypothetical protein